MLSVIAKDGRLTRKMVSLTQMEDGKAEMVFLNPGDQVFVAGKGFHYRKVFGHARQRKCSPRFVWSALGCQLFNGR